MKGMISKSMGEAPQPQEETDEGLDPGMPEGEGEDENDPEFVQALQFAMSSLYEKGAAKSIAAQLRSSQNVTEAIANVAYEVIVIVDERQGGVLDEELLLMLASHLLKEVVDIAKSAGVDVQPSDIAEALKLMTLRWLGENGIDTTQLQAAFDQFDTQSMNSMDMESGAGTEEGPVASEEGEPV